MTQLQKHNLANRIRRIPRRIHDLLTAIRATQKRIDLIEDDESIAPGVKEALIRGLRKSTGSNNAQVRALMDRGLELGISPQLLNA